MSRLRLPLVNERRGRRRGPEGVGGVDVPYRSSGPGGRQRRGGASSGHRARLILGQRPGAATTNRVRPRPTLARADIEQVLRAHLGVSRLSLPDAEEARAVTGYERYTITPLGASRAWPVIADASIVDRTVVAIGGGARGVNVHFAPADLVRQLGAEVVDVSLVDDRSGPPG
jgi:hypothetical protein